MSKQLKSKKIKTKNKKGQNTKKTKTIVNENKNNLQKITNTEEIKTNSKKTSNIVIKPQAKKDTTPSKTKSQESSKTKKSSKTKRTSSTKTSTVSLEKTSARKIPSKEKTKAKKDINLEKTKKEDKKIPILEKQHELIKDNCFLNIFIVTLITFSIELIFKKINNFTILDYASLRILISDILLATIITFISSITKHRWFRNTISLIYIIIYSFYAWLQLGFMNFLGVYISFNTSSQAGAVLDYIKDFLASFQPAYHVIYLPLILSITFYVLIRKKEYHKITFNLKTILIVPFTCLLCYGYYLTLSLSFMQNTYQVQNNLKLLLNPDVPSIAINQFGTSIFSIADLRTYLYPPTEEYTYDLSFNNDNEVEISREVSPVLNELAKNETNNKLLSLNKYFASQEITDFNDYTGMFEGMNVVFVFLESGSNALINAKYYPNFYQLYSEGWHWDNYYSPRNSCATGNNEFSALTGLYSIYNTCTTNTYKENTYFESLFGIFNAADYQTTSMHNFTEWYYYRKTSHKNMGSTYYGADSLKIKTSTYGEWPSDIELMEKAFNIILNSETSKSPWMTWITTVTSHQPYSSSSTYGDLYLKYFKEEGYSTNVARYMSKLKTVDDALGTMINALKESGVYDNTLIVMMPDHYPYGLKEHEIKEMYDTDYVDYEKEKVPFVMYNSSMEPNSYTSYTSYVDILPTVSNLLNVTYDPRLYMGTDLFSESHKSLVIFSDGSWKNEYAYYNASNGKLTEYVPNYYTNEEISSITNLAATKTSISTLAVKNNYFAYLDKKIKEYEETTDNEIQELTPTE